MSEGGDVAVGDNSEPAMKKRRVADENRVFNSSWEFDYCFIMPKDKPICLICHSSISVAKKANLQRHFTTMHGDFEKNYPSGTKVREDKIIALKRNLTGQQSSFRRMMKSSDCVCEASMHISWVLAKKQKPLSDGEMIKECFQKCAESLFSDFHNKTEIKKQISNLSLSHQTVARRVELLSRNVLSQLRNDLKNASGFSLALDESADISDTEQLMVYVRFDVNDEFKEDLLGVMALRNTTRGEDIYRALKECLVNNDIDLQKLVSVTTDGAPSMVGRRLGLIGHLMADNDFPDFHAYHCIIHQQSLCSKMKDVELDSVMKAVVKIVNFVRANPLHHRQFKALLSEYESNYDDVILHADVRWLSRGKVLSRVNDVVNELKVFLREKRKDDLLCHLECPIFLARFAFLTDITHHLNTLNLQMQGRQQTLPTLMNAVDVFVAKLDLFITQLSQSDFMHFPHVKKTAEQNPAVVQNEQFHSYLQNLKSEFSNRFQDIRPLTPLFQFVDNPFDCDVSVTASKMKLLGGDEGTVQLEIITLQHNTALRSKLKDATSTDFWMKYVDSSNFPELCRCCKKLLTMFGSTYVCEAGFSAMSNIKSKRRNSLTNEHLEDLLRAAVTEYRPEIKQISDSVQSQISH